MSAGSSFLIVRLGILEKEVGFHVHKAWVPGYLHSRGIVDQVLEESNAMVNEFIYAF